MPPRHAKSSIIVGTPICPSVGLEHFRKHLVTNSDQRRNADLPECGIGTTRTSCFRTRITWVGTPICPSVGLERIWTQFSVDLYARRNADLPECGSGTGTAFLEPP